MGMKRKTSRERKTSRQPGRWYRTLAGMALVALTACDVEGELDICPYNARLDYHYSPHGMERNELLGYVGKHCQYLFDEGGVLLDTIPLRGTAMLWGEFDLPPGAYTVVSWANLDSATAMPAVEPGRTTLDDLRPATSHPASAPAGFPSAGGWQADADALYYAYARFRVEAGKVTRKQVEFVSAHCRLTVKVRWKDRTPASGGDFRMLLRYVPRGYGSDPEYELDGGAYHIPRVYAEPRAEHVSPAGMDITREVNGEIRTARLRDADHPLFSLLRDREVLIRDIDLSRYFRDMGYRLDTNLLQDFGLLMEVAADGSVTVRPLGNSDWIDGGTVGEKV